MNQLADSEEARKKNHAKADKNSRTKEIRSGQGDSESYKMPFLIFHPESTFCLAWDIAVLLFLLYFIFAIPFRMWVPYSQNLKRGSDIAFRIENVMNVSKLAGVSYCLFRSMLRCPYIWCQTSLHTPYNIAALLISAGALQTLNMATWIKKCAQVLQRGLFFHWTGSKGAMLSKAVE